MGYNKRDVFIKTDKIGNFKSQDLSNRIKKI